MCSLGHNAHKEEGTDNAMPREDPLCGPDPLDITNPARAYFFLSDDAQDNIAGSDKEKMKCLSCGYQFTGEIYESCPKRFSIDTEEVADEKDDCLLPEVWKSEIDGPDVRANLVTEPASAIPWQRSRPRGSPGSGRSSGPWRPLYRVVVCRCFQR